MNTKLLDTLKEKWTKKSTKIACASVGTVAVLGVVGALIACNLPHTEQVIAEDGTVTTVQTPQKESHGLFDIFHAPAEQADAAQSTTTEITPPQTNANGTPISAPTAAPGTPQAAASGSVDNATGVAGATPASESAAPAPAPAAVEQSPAPAAEQSAAAEDESPAPAAEQKNQWVKPVWVVDQAEVKAIPPKYNIIDYYLTSDGKIFSIDQEEALRNYQETNHVSMGMRQKKEVIDPGRPYSPEKGHWADPVSGKRLSPTYERSH